MKTINHSRKFKQFPHNGSDLTRYIPYMNNYMHFFSVALIINQ